MSSSPRPVLCCAATEATYTTLARACTEAGLHLIRASPNTIASSAALPACALLIYDLTGDPAAAGRSFLHSWYRYCRGLPVLLYYPPRTVPVALLADLARLPGVVAYPHEAPSPEVVHRLAALLRALLAQRPGLLLSALLDGLSPRPPATLQAFVTALVERLSRGGAHAPTVATLATQAGLAPWRLRRACRRAHLPTPERLLEWLTLLYVLALADAERTSVATAASRAGLSPKYLRQLRHRLLPAAPALRGAIARDVLALALEEFSRRAGIPPADRARLAARLLEA